jgi:hypothetical protein
MSGLFGATVIKGNRITDFSDTTATVGVPIPFGYGRFVTGGNVIWAPLPPKEHVTKKRQGKGGVKQETYTYTLSYAVAASKGPIFGFWWIKRNGKIVWTQDPNAPVEDQAYAAKWRQKATFYYGERTQLPDSTIESYEGSGQVSAFRDIAYIVVEDDDVTDGAGAVPTYEFCVIASGLSYLTSKLYAVEQDDNLGSIARIVNGALEETTKSTDLVEPLGVMLALSSGALESIVKLYENPTENTASTVALVSGALESIVKQYEVPTENMASSVLLASGVLERVVQSTEVPTENMASTVQLTSGALEPV